MDDAMFQELARRGAKEAYVDYQGKLAAIRAAFPHVVDEPEPQRRQNRRRKVKARAKQRAKPAAEVKVEPPAPDNALVQAVLTVMPFNEPTPPSELLERVRKAGFTFDGAHHDKALARALARLVKMRMMKRAGHARGTRYTLLKKPA